MPTKSSHYKEAINISNNLTKEIDELIGEIMIKDIKEVEDLSDEDIDLLLKSIKIENSSLMTIIENKIAENKITSKTDIYDLKILLLLDHLGKKMFSMPKNTEFSNKKISNCKKNHFPNVDINFITYNYESTEALKPKKISKKILRRYKPETNI